MKLCDLVIAILLGFIIVLAIMYQLDTPNLERKNCVQTSMTDQQLAECIKDIK